jgi:spore coat polysaccharide biosynthesis protein SpsF
MVHIVCIVQARMGSTRFPGKVLQEINGKPILDYVFERLSKAQHIDTLVLATSTNKNDDILKKYGMTKNIEVFRGSEQDVLSRYFKAAEKYKADIIVRVTSDCPLIDPSIVDHVITAHLQKKVDYTSNVITRTYPRGLGVEAFNFEVLKDAYKHAQESFQREHVTPYITRNPSFFKLQNITAPESIRRPDIRITIDTKEDFELIKNILLHFKTVDFTTTDIIQYLNDNPYLLGINKHVQQKTVGSQDT